MTLAEALRKIADLNPEVDSDEGYNEWGEADCFSQAQEIARAALAAHDAQQQKDESIYSLGTLKYANTARVAAQQQYPYDQPPNTRPLSEVIAEWEADPEKKSALDRARAQQQEPLTDEQHQFILDNWCGYARLKNGVYELFGMRSCKAMEDGDWHPISVPFDPQTAQQQEPAQDAKDAARSDLYSDLADALGCDVMDSHAGRLARAKRLAAMEAKK
jgi:hypothetical protein